jgi:DNA-binding PadR family transcriptional regulator
MASPGPDVSIGPFEHDVLECLVQQPANAYGITLHNRLEDLHGRRFSSGAVYVTLERLERKGLITSRWGESTPERGGRRKRLYQIEASGRRAAEAFSERFRTSSASSSYELAWGTA